MAQTRRKTQRNIPGMTQVETIDMKNIPEIKKHAVWD